MGIIKFNKPILPEKFHFFEVGLISSSILKGNKDKIFQRKFDGTMAEVFVGYEDINYNDKNARIFGRGVLEYGITSEYSGRFPEIINAIKELGVPNKTDFISEIVIIDPKTGFESFRLLMARQRDRNIERYARLYPAIMIILDVVEVAGEVVTSLGYIERLEKLRSSITGSSNIIFFVNNSTDGLEEWSKVEENKLEGIIIRDSGARYGKGIWKLKREITEDVFCTGEYNKSDTLRYKGKELFASLKCYQLDEDGKEIYVADVGGGFDDKERIEMQEILDKGIMAQYPLVLEIKTLGRESSLKFKSPIYLRMRYDKPWSECKIK